ncbi:MAG: DEAD/DEAH box helicase [Pseudomonadota bacterium]
MARLSIQSEQVKHLVDTQVLPLLLATGTVGALTKLLNEKLLNTGAQSRLHPNRLHTLLSNDATRSLNEATVGMIEQAARAALESDRTIAEQAAIAFKSLQADARELRAFSASSLDEVAERLSIPPALAARLLDEAPSLAGAKAFGARGSTGTTPLQHEPPDWSYQDTAVARCVDAFSRRPAGRVGLVLPTGAGKTRTALRIVLTMLEKNLDIEAPAYWVTHRRNLREQAYRELQRLIAAQERFRDGERLAELARRIKFVMVGDLTPLLEGAATRPALIIVDEAHHAAAPSYQPVFANPWAAPVLLLTATPNRSDRG